MLKLFMGVGNEPSTTGKKTLDPIETMLKALKKECFDGLKVWD